MNRSAHDLAFSTGKASVVVKRRASFVACLLATGSLFLQPAVAQAQSFRVLYPFNSNTDGYSAQAGLLQASNGLFYGATGYYLRGSGAFFVFRDWGDLLFPRPWRGAAFNCSTALIQGADGRLYGTDTDGGKYGFGDVFALDPVADTFTSVYDFTNGSDGAFPVNGVVQGSDGRLYGATIEGPNGVSGDGTLYAVSTSGAFSLLYTFVGASDGTEVRGRLIQASDGNLYGAAYGGGAFGRGTVFKCSTSGTFQVLHSFTGGSDGYSPYSGLLQASDGNMYGVNSSTIYSIDPTGQFAVTYHGLYGQNSSLSQASNGLLYGTCSVGGYYKNGCVYSVDEAGLLETVYSFTSLDPQGVNVDGEYP
ncbi:MAG TPA: choice-of-anchor tandem repeat GloVer-containing protein, partial [Chthonomonadales bacterium]|nr:choice-of-anchor tandem repeat GloVer-containing protein [Chthonomonadales bacterium]